MNVNLTRRRFIKAVIASSAVASQTGCQLGSKDLHAKGSVERLISLDINGKRRRVDVLPQETLASTLRYKLGLTGTKIGCNRGECGACTVLIDDIPNYACSTLSHSVRKRQVQSIEGVANKDGTLHPIQEADNIWRYAGQRNGEGIAWPWTWRGRSGRWSHCRWEG